MWIASRLAQDAVHIREQAGIGELLCGQVDGDALRRKPQIAPTSDVAADGFQDQPADRADETNLLRNADEFRREQQTPLRMPPSDESLRSGESARLDIDLRLLVNLEFAPRHRMAQLVFQGKALDAVHVDVVRIELVVILAGGFRAIHCDVGILEQ